MRLKQWQMRLKQSQCEHRFYVSRYTYYIETLGQVWMNEINGSCLAIKDKNYYDFMVSEVGK